MFLNHHKSLDFTSNCKYYMSMKITGIYSMLQRYQQYVVDLQYVVDQSTVCCRSTVVEQEEFRFCWSLHCKLWLPCFAAAVQRDLDFIPSYHRIHITNIINVIPACNCNVPVTLCLYLYSNNRANNCSRKSYPVSNRKFFLKSIRLALKHSSLVWVGFEYSLFSIRFS